jgi:hypothetical protein
MLRPKEKPSTAAGMRISSGTGNVSEAAEAVFRRGWRAASRLELTGPRFAEFTAREPRWELHLESDQSGAIHGQTLSALHRKLDRFLGFAE